MTEAVVESGSIKVPEAIALLQHAMLTLEGRRSPYSDLETVHRYGEMTMMPEGWLAVFGYSAASEVMKSPDFGRHNPNRTTWVAWPRPLTSEEEAELIRHDTADLGLWLQLIDPPEHTRQRRLVGRAFTPRHMQQFEESIRTTLTELLDAAPRGVPFDLLEKVAYPLPRQVIGELVGLELVDRDRFARLARTQLAERDPMTSFDELVAAADARAEIARMVRDVVAVRRAQGGNDFASELIRAEADGDRLSESELIALISMIYIAGYGTTAHAIANGLHTLLTNPDAMAELRADPSLAPAAADEVLRLNTNVLTIDYFCKNDTVVAGTQVRAGTSVQVLLGAANHDPAVFPSPGRFDMHRQGPPGLAFGLGPHTCLGKPLAKLELILALNAIIERFERIRLVDEEPCRFDSFTYREFTSFPVIFE
jgi:cytochrome P450